jgi:GAF domain-containing protein
LLVSAVSTISYVALVVLQRLGYLTPLLPYDPQGQVLLSVGSRLLMFFLLAFLGWLSSQNLRRALQQARETAGRWQELNETLEQRVAERTREGEWRATQIATGAEISRIASQELDPDRLLRTVADLIGKRFQFYYVGIFIVDNEGRNAVLRAVTGPAGQTMLERGHQLEVGGTSMVGWVCANRKARIALDVGEEPVRFANPLLPFTRSEMALPLRVGDRVIGALDIQSMQAQAFDENDITALQGMADQIAVALENARLFQQTQSSLKELERANRLLTGQGWQEFLHARPADFAEFHQAGLAPLTPEETDRLASSKMDGAKRIHVPLRLRGEVVGSLVVERTPDQPAWSASECEMLEAAADQAAQTMDGVRLFEESQRLAAREQVIGTVTARMRESLDVDRVLQTAVREFAETLGVAEVKIRLMPDNQRPAVNG